MMFFPGDSLLKNKFKFYPKTGYKRITANFAVFILIIIVSISGGFLLRNHF